ncbi:MAG: 30S ribosomal protein S16 [bacterium]
MAVIIRMRRMGRKNRPHYRIVATDKRSPRDGRFIELLGTYDPLKEGKNFDLKMERVLYWVGVGAEVSDAVGTFLAKEGIKKEPKKKKAKKARRAKETEKK